MVLAVELVGALVFAKNWLSGEMTGRPIGSG